MKKTILPKRALRETLLIIAIATVLGIGTNAFNPNGVVIGFKRPSLTAAADSVLAVTLPEVAVAPDVQGAQDEIVHITTEQVQNLVQKGQALLIDARSQEEYDDRHIPNSINLPFENIFEFQTKIDSLPRDKWLVCFCDGPPCDLGELLANELVSMGFRRVVIYHDGLNAWRKAGGKAEGSQDAN